MSETRGLLVARCASCHGRFLPRPGHCPRCGSVEVAPYRIPPEGRVLAAVELLSPSTGWPAPHRLALVQLAESIRLIALVPGSLPGIGEEVVVERDGDRFQLTALGPVPPATPTS